MTGPDITRSTDEPTPVIPGAGTDGRVDLLLVTVDDTSGFLCRKTAADAVAWAALTDRADTEMGRDIDRRWQIQPCTHQGEPT